jgi:hypothetical protein
MNKKEKARLNYEYALKYYKEGEGVSGFQQDAYVARKHLYQGIIEIKKDMDMYPSARNTAREYVEYIKTVITEM